MPDLYIDGSWIPARGGGRREIRCPHRSPAWNDRMNAGVERGEQAEHHALRCPGAARSHAADARDHQRPHRFGWQGRAGAHRVAERHAVLEGDQVGLGKRRVDTGSKTRGDAIEWLAELGEMLDERAAGADAAQGFIAEHEPGIAPRDLGDIARAERLGVEDDHSGCHLAAIPYVSRADLLGRNQRTIAAVGARHCRKSAVAIAVIFRQPAVWR